MVTAINEKICKDDNPERNSNRPSLAKSAGKPESQLLLSNTFITHTPKAGLNPLVDAAAYLFSIMGKLKQLKSHRHLTKLRKELIQEITTFQDTAKRQGYSSEYILVSRYALCATLDDIITNTTWGTQGQWEAHTLLAAFNQESINQDRFFIILERLVKDPNLYIDVMEFMYLCLSMGFKGQYRLTEFNNNQLEQIINALYKRIRTYRGDFSKTLSPFPVKPMETPEARLHHMPGWLIVLLTISVSLAIFAGIRFMLNITTTQAYQDLIRMGKMATYERDNQAH